MISRIENRDSRLEFRESSIERLANFFEENKNFSEINPIALSTPIQRRLLSCDQIGSFSNDDGAGKKTSLENKHLRNCNYFAIIPSCSHFTIGSLRNHDDDGIKNDLHI